MPVTDPTMPGAALAPAAPAFRAALWRWHFFAGLFVMPVLMLMALTGALYLFRPEIEAALYRPMMTVTPGAAQASADDWVAAAQAAAGGGDVIAAAIPARADRAVRLTARRPDGTQRDIFIDPWSARVTGDIQAGGAMETVKRLHSLTRFGAVPNILVEVVAGWTIVMVLTGLILWLPRRGPARRAQAAFAWRRGDPKGRPFWRNLHAVTGFYAALLILFLALTGMAWSPIWGDRVMGAARDAGWGRPEAPPAASQWSHAPAAHRAHGVGWTMERTALHMDHPAPAPLAGGLSRVMAASEAAGMARPYLVSMATDPALAWTVAYQGPGVADARSLYVDPASGAALADLRWPQFGAGARVFEWSIATHQGLEYGWANRIVLLLACVAVWALAISGAILWWRRRPRGRLASPPRPAMLRARLLALGVIAPVGLLFPPLGATMLLALIADAGAERIGAIRRRRAA